MTSLQFDDSRIVSGGSDGRVKVWDLQRGQLVRELGQPAEAVWRVVFEEEKAVVLASRNARTVMEVWNFSPPSDEERAGRSASPAVISLPDVLTPDLLGSVDMDSLQEFEDDKDVVMTEAFSASASAPADDDVAAAQAGEETPGMEERADAGVAELDQ